ncbi:MAG: urea ABC transporter substrate-binding protein [Treponema sp.]|nr:urea ABC transporter substrate-binding protein [Treponema sp.]
MRKNKMIIAFLIFVIAGLIVGCKRAREENQVKVGLLHSLSGTMALSEIPVRDAELLAIKEINAAGGVLGKQIVALQEDGESEPVVFTKKANKLLKEDKVATVFGCWTSASRKAVKPVFEDTFGLLWYPVQYEGMEASPNIMYMGASPNQQVVPAVDYCAEHFGKRMYLLGSDYVFPQTANTIIKSQLKKLGGTCMGEKYIPLGETDFREIVRDIKELKPDVVLNTLNGDSNIAFFEQLMEEGITERDIHIMSFSIAEEEINYIGVEKLEGHLVTWNYFQTTDTAENERFVKEYKKMYGENRRTGDPIEAGYIAVYMWAMACEKAGSFDVEAVRMAAKNLKFNAPEGQVIMDNLNQHLAKPVRIGRINKDGLIDEIWSTNTAIKPDPYLSTYDWARGL